MEKKKFELPNLTVEKLSEDQLIAILEKRVEETITKEYYKGLRFGLYDRKD